MVRKVRPRVSKYATVGVFAWTAVFGGRFLLAVRAHAVDPLGVPGRQVVGLGQPAEEIADVRVILRIRDQDGVVDIPGLLPPGIEDDLLVGVVGMERGDHALDRVVAEDGADADRRWPNSNWCVAAEERLVLADRLALVVEDRPAAADPARIDDR